MKECVECKTDFNFMTFLRHYGFLGFTCPVCKTEYKTTTRGVILNLLLFVIFSTVLVLIILNVDLGSFTNELLLIFGLGFSMYPVRYTIIKHNIRKVEKNKQDQQLKTLE
jgi:hypothetical protein